MTGVARYRITGMAWHIGCCQKKQNRFEGEMGLRVSEKTRSLLIEC
jgi:hypothetical protein